MLAFRSSERGCFLPFAQTLADRQRAVQRMLQRFGGRRRCVLRFCRACAGDRGDATLRLIEARYAASEAGSALVPPAAAGR